MKKFLPIILVLCLMLCSCGGGGTEETTTAAPEETTLAAEEITYRNPLNGEIIPEEYTGRVFATTINNVSPALPHIGVSQADLFFEMYINDYCTRGLALFTDVKSVPAIGSLRSCRQNFIDLAQGYNLILCHTGGSDLVLSDLASSGIDHMAIDVPVGYRDADRLAQGYSYEHTLLAKGESLYNAAESKGYSLTAEGKNYGLSFADEVTLDGAAVNEIEIVFTIKNVKKTSTMTYDSAADGYTYTQYGKTMTDGGETLRFKNVIVILAPTENVPHYDYVYHVADLVGTGDAYFFTGGKYAPIKWSRAAETEPFNFTMADGSEVQLEAGSSYIAIAPTGSPVNMK